MSRTKLPPHSQLLLPLLQELSAQGGTAKPQDLYPVLEEKFSIDTEKVKKYSTNDNAFRNRLRWVRQHAVKEGLIKSPERNLWELTNFGDKTLGLARPGLIITVFEDSFGRALWASASDAAGVIDDKSLNLIMSSPPYPLVTPREYGNLNSENYVPWLAELAHRWKDLLTDDGSLILNLGQVGTAGKPGIDPYISRLIVKFVDELGYHLQDQMIWHNPTALPGPRQWVTVERRRLKQAAEHILWFGKSPFPKANNRNCLRPYAESTLRAAKKSSTDPNHWTNTTQTRPSGHNVSPSIYSIGEGAIPPNVFIFPHEGANSPYRRACKAAGLEPHPAMFPEQLPTEAIKLTTDAGDLVYDPFCGSGTTLVAAKKLGRYFLGTDLSLKYLETLPFRFAA